MIVKSTKPVPGRCGHKAPRSSFVLRFELLVSCSLNKGCVVPPLVRVCRKTAENLQSQSGTSPRLGAPSKACTFVMEDSHPPARDPREVPAKILAGQG